MVEITLKNGSKFQIKSLVFHGKIIDSNGSEPGGNATYPFTESDIDKLNSIIPLQAAYNAVYLTEQTTSDNGAEDLEEDEA